MVQADLYIANDFKSIFYLFKVSILLYIILMNEMSLKFCRYFFLFKDNYLILFVILDDTLFRMLK